MRSNTAAPTDYDLHGLAGIRLIDASPSDMAAVTRQLGPIQKPLTREPDIIIRFVDRLVTDSAVRLLGLDDAGFTDDAFLVLRSKHGAPAKVAIPFEQIGEQCEIVCERGLPAVPLLIPILNLSVLSNGALPLHAGAFVYKQTGILTTGWSKGGKTEALLAFMSRGAAYVGDEWVYISADGRHMYGIPEPIRVWDWHLNDLPNYRALLGRGARGRLRLLRFLVEALDWGTPKGRAGRSGGGKAARRVGAILKRQLYVDLPPRRLFGEESCRLAGTLDKIVFVASHESADVAIRPMDAQEIGRRMVFSLEHERLNFMAYYLKFRFAFPEKVNPLIERAEELQRERLEQVLAGKDAYALYHPYPVSIPSLFGAISPLCGQA